MHPCVSNFVFLFQIDWTETWLQGILGIHLLIFLLAVLTRKCLSIQCVLFIILLTIVYLGESLNSYGARHWKYFSNQQYFDSSGMFFSIIISFPLLFNCLFIMVSL